MSGVATARGMDDVTVSEQEIIDLGTETTYEELIGNLIVTDAKKKQELLNDSPSDDWYLDLFSRGMSITITVRCEWL